MITLIYHVNPEEKQAELEWLREQKIFPGCEDYYDWIKQKQLVRFGVIVSTEQALSVKLRHKLDMQENYRQK